MQGPRKRTKQAHSAASAEYPVSSSNDTWFVTPQTRIAGPKAGHENGASSRSTSFPTELPTPRHSSPAGTSDASRESSVASGAPWTDLPLATASFSQDNVKDVSMDDGLPYAAGHETPTPASRNARSAKNREKAMGKKKWRKEKHVVSDISVQSAGPSNAQGGTFFSSQQEVEGLIQPSGDFDTTTSAVESLVDTFHPEVVVGFAVGPLRFCPGHLFCT